MTLRGQDKLPEPRGQQRGDNGITRREFDAVVTPIRDDVKGIRRDMERVEQRIATGDDLKRIEALVNTAIGQWHQSNASFTETQNALEKKVAFAQGAVAVLSFLIGAGVLTGVVLTLITYR